MDHSMTSAEPTPLIWGKTLKQRVRTAAKKVPRFLFRVGPRILHDGATFTHDAIIPGFFRQVETPTNIFQMPLQELRDHNKIHFAGQATDSLSHGLWSIWKASLPSAAWEGISYRAKHGYHAGNQSIAVLDTERCKDRNIVLHENDFSLMQHENSGRTRYQDCYFTFGRIPATAFALVSMKVFEAIPPSPGLPSNPSWSAIMSEYTNQEDAMDANSATLENFVHTVEFAKQLGTRFGKDFELPMACMAISELTRPTDDPVRVSIIFASFKDFETPSSRSKERSITKGGKLLAQVPGARRAVQLLRAIIKDRRKQEKIRKDDVAGIDDAATKSQRFAFELRRNLTEPDDDDDSSDYSSRSSSVSSNGSGEDVFTEDSSHGEEQELPRGQMDDASKVALLRIEKRTPRYLFRGWRNGPSPSGGFHGLNTRDAITPRAFLHRKAHTDKTLYDLSRNQLQQMCLSHLGAESPPNFYTEFSSWAADLAVAIRYAGRETDEAFISIIDTRELRNTILHVTSLRAVVSVPNFTEEYLAHGVITGPAHRAVRCKTFMDAGVRMNRSLPPPSGTAQRTLPNGVLTQEEVDTAKSVAVQYGPKFGAAVMLAIVCLGQRNRQFWWKDMKSTVELLHQNMLDFEIPPQLCADETVLADIVYTQGYYGLQQMIRILRALIELRHGKGARARKSLAPWASGNSRPGNESDTEL